MFLTAKAQETPKPEFKPSAKLTAQVFGDYFYKAAADSARRGNTQYAKAPSDFNAFSVRRVYLGGEYNFTDWLTAETIISMEPGADTPGASGRNLFIKSANIRWKNIYKGADLVIGQQSTPTFVLISEKTWGYRPIEKTIMDQRRVASSNDIGVGLQAKFGSRQQFGYNVMIGNDNGANQENDKSKRIYASIYGKFIDKRLIVELYDDYSQAKRGTYTMSKMTPKVHIGWWQPDTSFVVGVEVFQQLATNPTGANTKTAPIGISAYMRGALKKDMLNAFARFDYFDPDAEHVHAGSIEEFWTVGLDFMPKGLKNFHIMPNVWYNGYHNKTENTTGKLALDHDMVDRITFFYVFK